MAVTKRYWATVSVPSSFLKTLPEFATPAAKSKFKKPSDGPSTSVSSTTPKSKAKGKVTKGTASPTPENVVRNKAANFKGKNGKGGQGGQGGANGQGALSNFKINSGLKESSTSGLTMNSITSAYTLDKSGSPCKKWVKKPLQFKTFSGFKVKYTGYGQAEEEESTEEKAKVKEEPTKSISSTPDIRSEA